MTLRSMQEVFSRILTDSQFRCDFYNDPQKASYCYNLNKRELRSLVNIDRKRLSAHSRQLQYGRMELGLKAFPITKKLLKNELNENLITEFCQEHPPRIDNDAPLMREANSVYRYLLTVFRKDLNTHMVHLDVLEFEHDLILLAYDTAFWKSASETELNNSKLIINLSDTEFNSLKPRLSDHIKERTFETNVPYAIRQIEMGKEVANLPIERTTIVFSKQPNRMEIGTFVINGQITELLSQCDGYQSIYQIIYETAKLYKTDRSNPGFREFQTKVIEALKTLLAQNVLTSV